jgi:hypothetical protein
MELHQKINSFAMYADRHHYDSKTKGTMKESAPCSLYSLLDSSRKFTLRILDKMIMASANLSSHLLRLFWHLLKLVRGLDFLHLRLLLSRCIDMAPDSGATLADE